MCSEVIAPIRSEADDISLYIINFEDLTHPPQCEAALVNRLSKCKFVRLDVDIITIESNIQRRFHFILFGIFTSYFQLIEHVLVFDNHYALVVWD